MIDPFWLGVLTPFAIVIAIATLWLLLAFAVWAWGRIDRSLWKRVDLKKNLVGYNRDKGVVKREPEYIDAANEVRDALLKSPRFHGLRAFGWMVVFIRNWQDVTQYEPSEREDDE